MGGNAGLPAAADELSCARAAFADSRKNKLNAAKAEPDSLGFIIVGMLNAVLER
jgi:hypothetical protein